jgi:lipopolysaccharide/colanic/teichoic acid biosynthesis glycosyltransferase
MSPAEAGGEPHPGLPHSLQVVVSAAGLLVTLPILALAAAAIRLTSPGPAFFRQERVGRSGRPFFLLKLRTMKVEDGPQVTASGDPRVTGVGRFLRKTKLDEMPQLWNVVRGEMALVGPRPEVATYVDFSDPAWRKVLETRPGITDPVSLRLRFEEELLASAPGDRGEFYRQVMVPFKVRKYIEYQSIRTPWSDLGVLLQTVLSGLFSKLVQPYQLEDLTSSPEGPIQQSRPFRHFP